MMAQDQEKEELYAYKEGFNSGYVIARAEPDLAQLLAGIDIKGKSPFIEGVGHGAMQYMWEMQKQKPAPEREHGTPVKTPGKDDPGREDPELER